MKHMITIGQRFTVSDRSHLYVPLFEGRHIVMVLHDDWAVMGDTHGDYTLARIIEQHRLTRTVGGRLKHSPVTIVQDLQHTWCELQDFRFVQTMVTGGAGIWYIERWLNEHDIVAQRSDYTLYGSSRRKSNKLTGKPIDITAECI